MVFFYNLIRKIRRNVKQHGVIATAQKSLQHAIGLGDVKEEVESLHYFLNVFRDASNVPPASNMDLRILQLCDVQFLRIVTKMCDSLGLKYWLDYGSLLGAVRHKGFIPWDDDIDISMPRSDYNNAIIKLREALSSYGIQYFEIKKLGHIRFGYNTSQTGIWIDILAMDDYHTEEDREKVIKMLGDTLPKYRMMYNRHINSATVEKRTEWRNKIIGGLSGQNHFLYMTPEFPYPRIVAHHVEDALPLSKIEFEGYFFNAPNHYDLYLRDIYGNNYMGFPRKGVLHHDSGEKPLWTLARQNKIDMNVVYDELKNIADSI